MKLVLNIVLPLVVLGLLLATLWYVPMRLATLLGLDRTWPLRVGWALGGLASLGALVGFATPPNPVLGFLYVGSGLVFMAHLYLDFLLLVLHPLQGRLPLSNRTTVWAAVAIAVGFTLLGAWKADDLTVETQEIAVAGLDEPRTVMHISDVHLGHHRGRAFLERVVQETNQASPDFVVITGDLIDGNSALNPDVLEPLSRFEAPVYFVIGNHETYVDLDRALTLIGAQGIHILHNERIDTHGFQLVGLDYMNADEETFDMHPVGDRTIRNELPQIPADGDTPILLLHHSPVGLEYVADYGTALMLAGHTHAGQVFPGTVFAPLIFRLNKGLYEYEGMQVFVSQGAGTFGPMMRLGSTNAIHVLRLLPR